MGPSDHPRPLPDGAACTACGASVPTGHIRILARRDDLAFVELACPGCGSAAIGLLVPASSADGSPVLDVAADPPIGGRPPAHLTPDRAITEADVAAVRADLAAWSGDLVGWLDAPEHGGPTVDR
jgi:hypothetical protein